MTAASLSRTKQVREKRIKLGGCSGWWTNAYGQALKSLEKEGITKPCVGKKRYTLRFYKSAGC